MNWKLDPAVAMEKSRPTIPAPAGAGNQRKSSMMRTLASAIMAGSLIVVLFACSGPSNHELSSPSQLFDVLTNCETVVIAGRLPQDSVGHAQLAALPFTLRQRSEIDRLAAVIRGCHLSADPEFSAKLCDGVKFATSIHATITIDSRWHFRLLASDRVIFANDMAYRAVTTNTADSFFALDIASLLEEIQREHESAH